MTASATTAVLSQQRAAAQSVAAELRDVTWATHRRHRLQMLVDTVNLQIRRGEVTTLLSRRDTSAGNMLDLLDGRAEPSWGSVRVAGQEITRLNRRELHQFRHHHVARVWPGFGIQPKLTVRQNLVIAQRQSGRPADLDWIDRVTEVVGLSGMLGFGSAPDADQRRGLWAVARSLLGRPTVVLVNDLTPRVPWSDKPGVLNALRVAAGALDVAVVIATRDPSTAAATDRVVLLDRGRVVDDTAPDEPASTAMTAHQSGATMGRWMGASSRGKPS
jgi:putative ABC transport system ATP-binding protein